MTAAARDRIVAAPTQRTGHRVHCRDCDYVYTPSMGATPTDKQLHCLSKSRRHAEDKPGHRVQYTSIEVREVRCVSL